MSFKRLKDRAGSQVQLMLGFWWNSYDRTRELEQMVGLLPRLEQPAELPLQVLEVQLGLYAQSAIAHHRIDTHAADSERASDFFRYGAFSSKCATRRACSVVRDIKHH